MANNKNCMQHNVSTMTEAEWEKACSDLNSDKVNIINNNND